MDKAAVTSPLPLVSVCIPTYNRASRLEGTVERLLACKYPRLEIIIADNASTDGTEALCDRLVRRHPSILYLRRQANFGPTDNFEFARQHASGTYFLWHGDDDWLDPDYIPLCVQALEDDSKLVLASGVSTYRRPDGSVSRRGNVVEPSSGPALLRVLHYAWLVDDNSLFYGVYRRAQVASCTIPNSLGNDWAWLAEVLTHGSVKVIREAMQYRDEGGDNTSASVQRIVRVLGLPAWHADYPRFVIPWNVAWHLAGTSNYARRSSIPWRAAVLLTVLPLQLLRMLLHLAIPKLPGGAGFYRRHFSERGWHDTSPPG